MDVKRHTGVCQPGRAMRFLPASLVLWAAMPVMAQTSRKPVYVESFRKGPTKIVENTLHVNLDTKSPNYKVGVKDSTGKERFVFSFTPARVGEEDKTILSWGTGLEDLWHRFYGNLLVPNRDPYLNGGPTGKALHLDPNPYAVVPLDAERIFKVEDFYCVIQVTKHHQVIPQKWQLDAMEVDVQFTNTNPLVAGDH